jgi:MSHA biogenesis protein MshP
MYLNQPTKNNQLGFGLPSALFLILVMILLVAGLNQINEINASAYGREWLSMRAFYAAESGAQAAAVYALNSSQTMPTCNSTFIDGLDLTETGLSQCSVDVTCSEQIVDGQVYYTFTSNASCGSGADTGNRVIQTRLRP